MSSWLRPPDRLFVVQDSLGLLMFSLLFKEFGQSLANVLATKVSFSHEIRLDWNSKVIPTPTTEPICLLWYSLTPGTYFDHLLQLTTTTTNIQPRPIIGRFGDFI